MYPYSDFFNDGKNMNTPYLCIEQNTSIKQMPKIKKIYAHINYKKTVSLQEFIFTSK